MLTGKILVLGGAESRLGENGRIPRPFVVVHSGSTTMIAEGFSASSAESVVRRADGGGWRVGGRRASCMARKRDMRCTSLVVGYDAVKMGSKMAAR